MDLPLTRYPKEERGDLQLATVFRCGCGWGCVCVCVVELRDLMTPRPSLLSSCTTSDQMKEAVPATLLVSLRSIIRCWMDFVPEERRTSAQMHMYTRMRMAPKGTDFHGIFTLLQALFLSFERTHNLHSLTLTQKSHFALTFFPP